MSKCAEHKQLNDTLIRIDERTKNLEEMMSSYLTIAQWVFGLVFVVGSSILGYNIMRTDDLRADVNDIKSELLVPISKKQDVKHDDSRINKR